MNVTYPPSLPVSAQAELIKRTVKAHPVVIIAGETGSGKTTQIPKMCMALGYHMIAHTQPRRIAARSVATRIEEELKEANGGEGHWVGYKVRFSDTVRSDTRIKLLTDGMLLAEMQQDRRLTKYDVIIIDEAHERTLNIDFLLGFLKKLVDKRPELRVIITSATIDQQRFSKHFNDAPVIEVSGRSYPVTLNYRGIDVEEGEWSERVAGAVDEILRNERTLTPSERPARDILAFFSGERDIREVSLHLRKRYGEQLEVLPLYARLSQSEQNRIFNPGARRRLVLSTNVAETSLTVPNIGYVIDTGLARISRYSVRSKMQRLPIEPISQASADQRAGRCGRIGPGICYRLYDEQDYLSRPEFTDPEILRTHLAAVILQMHTLKLGAFERFPFLDAPDTRLVNDGYQLLDELGALKERWKVTPVGHQLAQLPIDPRLGRVLIDAAQRGVLREAIIVCSGLSVLDPRDTPASRTEAAQQIHRQWVDERSEFVSYLNLWGAIEEAYESCSRREFSRWCKKQVLSELRIREWRDLIWQLKLSVKSLNYVMNQGGTSLDYASLHRALLSGFMHHIARSQQLVDASASITSVKPMDAQQKRRLKERSSDYEGVRNRTLTIFPGSTLKKKRFRWLLAAEIIETQRVYAHRIAAIEPEWVEEAVKPWLRRSHAEPHWEKRRGQVVALEQATFYGLVIYSGRRVHFAPHDPELARDLFIREGLVAEQVNTRLGFYQHNGALRKKVEALEEKRRRRNILVDDQALVAFYSERIPSDIVQMRSLERWVKRNGDQSLYMQESDLMVDDADDITDEAYPNVLMLEGHRFDLAYQFDPTSERDGVTLKVPLALLPVLASPRLEWLVPGLLPAKCEALLRGLPKAKRKNFVPVPNYVQAFLQAFPLPQGSLYDALSSCMRKMTGVIIEPHEWPKEALSPCHRFHHQVVDAKGQVVDEGRDLGQLQTQLRSEVNKAVADSVVERSKGEAGVASAHDMRYTEWTFADLDESVQQNIAGRQVTLYPALSDQGDAVEITLLATPEERDRVMRSGLCRLCVLHLKESVRYIKKSFKKELSEIAMQLLGAHAHDALLDNLMDANVMHVFIEEAPLIYKKAAFEQRLATGRNKVVPGFQAMLKQLQSISQRYRAIKRLQQQRKRLEYLESMNDVVAQIDALLPADFIKTTPTKWIARYPAYMDAILYRLERLPQQLKKDRSLQLEWQRTAERVEKRLSQLSSSDPRRGEVQWWLQEFRISLFAQQVGTMMPVSAKRIDKFLSS